MANKKLIFLISCIVIVLAFLFRSYSSADDSRKEQLSHDNSVSNKKIENIVDKTTKPNLSNSNKVLSSNIEQGVALVKQELEGKIKDEYGIRNDIYKFIEDNVPNSNKMAVISAIKLAQYSNQIYYHSTNKKEAIELSKKEALALSCLEQSLPKIWLTISEGIAKLMRNNQERDKHMWDIDEKYFGWKVLGTGLTDSEEKEKCKSGNF